MNAIISLLFFSAFLLGCMQPAAAQNTEELFRQYELPTGHAQQQTILTGFLLGGAMAEVVVLNIDESDQRRLLIYVFADNQWVPGLDTKPGPEVLFVDVVNIGGLDRLIGYEHGRFNWFDPVSGKEHLLLEVATNYVPNTDPWAGFDTIIDGEIPHIDISHDLNLDGRDDLILPDTDGFWIAIQLNDGSFTEAVKLGPPEPFLDEVSDQRSYRELGINGLTIPWYLSRVHMMDHDQDGRSDLVFWNRDHFEVHHQDEHGLFDTEAKSFTTPIPIDSDGAYTLMFGYDDESTMSFIFGSGEKSKRTVLQSLSDINSDNVADLVTHSLEGSSRRKQSSTYEVRFGESVAGGTRFSQDVSTTIRSRGKAGLMQPWGYSSQYLQDLDDDGQLEMLRQDVNMGIGKMFRAMVGNSITLNLEIHRLENGTFSDKTTTTRKIRPDIKPFSGAGNVFFPVVLIGDVNGDGRKDLLAGQNPGELQVFLGEPAPDLLARRALKVAVTLPYDERNTSLVDLNQDGKQDLLLHLTPTDHAPKLPYRVVMLIAN